MNQIPADPQTSVQIERILPAAPSRVFEAWTSPEAIRFWFGGADMAIDAVEVDLRVGGKYTIIYRDGAGNETVVAGRYLRVEPNRHLVFTWTMKSRQLVVDENIVTVEFRDLDGQTQVRLIHEPFADPDVRGLHAQGWNVCLIAVEQLLQK